MKVEKIMKRFGVKFAGKLDPEGIGPGVIMSYDFVTELTVDAAGSKVAADEVSRMTQEAVMDVVEEDIRQRASEDPRFALVVQSADAAVSKVHQRARMRASPVKASPVKRRV
jgi:hypothetical protein